MAQHNRSIGRFHLGDIPPAPRGMPQIEVTFDIDANGILNVSAKEKQTGKEQSIRIEASTGLSDEEIKRMKDEAKANEESDKQAREKADKVNQADSLIFQTERQLNEYGDKLSEGNKTAIQTALEQLKIAHKSQDVTAIDAALAALNGAWQAASQEIYQAQQQAQPGANGAENANPGAEAADDVQDVEFEEVEDDAKA